jgi:hypothetical protein
LYNYLNNPLFIEYQKEFNSGTKYTDLSKLFKMEKSQFFFHITLESKKNEKKFNYFGKEIIIPDYLLKNYSLKKKVYQYFYSLILDYKIKGCSVLINLLDDNSHINLKNKKIINEMYVNLKEPENIILKKFSQRHRTTLNKNYDDINYEIIDHTNYSGQITEMKKMHIEISKKESRSNETWIINEQMIKNDNGFLIKINNKHKCIGYYFFFYDNLTSVYFSSVTYREYFKIYKNLGHKAIWNAVIYSKKKSQYFFLGWENLNEPETDKEKNITLFKKGFCGFKKRSIILENNEDFLNFMKN